MLNKILLATFVVCFTACSATVSIPTTDGMVSSEVQPKQSKHDFFSGLFLVDDLHGNKIRYAIQYLAPTKIRIELFPTTSFYQLGLLVINDDKYIYKNNTENVEESGPFSPEVLREKLGLHFSREQLVSAVTQSVPTNIAYDSYLDKDGQLFTFAKDKSFIGQFDQTQVAKEFFFFNEDEITAKLSFQNPLPLCQSEIFLPRYDVKLSVQCMAFKSDKQPDESRFLLR